MKKMFKMSICWVVTVSVLLAAIAGITATEKDATALEESAGVNIADRVLTPLIVEEDVTKRSENEKHFLCDDGTYIAIKYPVAVHKFENGEWVDNEYELTVTDAKITPKEDGGWASLAVTPVTGEKLVSVKADGYDVSWEVEVLKSNKISASKQALGKTDEMVNTFGINNNVSALVKTTEQVSVANSNRIAEKSENTFSEVSAQKNSIKKEINSLKYDLETITDNPVIKETNRVVETYNREQILNFSAPQSVVEYNCAFGEDITLRYLYSPNRINEEIVLDSLNGFKAYCMKMDTDGLTAVLDVTNKVYLKDSLNNTVITIAAPYMYDSNDVLSTDVEVSLLQKGDVCIITYTPDEEWLNSSERSWPVVIDPVVSNSVNVPQIDQLDNYVYSGQPYAVDDCSPTLKVGYEGGAEHWTYWGVQDWIPSMPSGANIVGIDFNIRFQGGTTTMGDIGLYFVGGNTLDTYNLTWYNKPALNDLIDTKTSVPADLWLSFSSGSLSAQMIENHEYSISYIDFALKYTSYCNDFNWFFSSDYRPNGSLSYIPYLEVRYNYGFVERTGRFSLQNVKSSRYLTVLNGSAVNNASVVQAYAAEETFYDHQTWEIQYDNNAGCHSIASMISTNYRLVCGTNNSAVISSNSTSVLDEWKIEKTSNGRYIISLKDNPMSVLAVSGGSMSENAAVCVTTYTGDDSQLWLLNQQPLPVNGSEISYSMACYQWDNAATLKCNCYSYAIDNQLHISSGYVWREQMPGAFSLNGFTSELSDSTIGEFIACIENDFKAYFGANDSTVNNYFKPIGQYEVCPTEMYKIALVYSGGGGFHLYRQNSDGLWSHTTNDVPISRVDSSNQVIVDPQNADRDSYNKFYGYFAVRPWNRLYPITTN
ncbi:MAG: RICIN domain-containing protein [Clostridia bacterium]|nr:RICIN domain-containing protein [Clostridia bacterium]